LARRTVGHSVLVLAQARDPDCQHLAPSAFQWSSDADGPLGTGESLYLDSLSPGRHILTLQVTDAGGQTAADSIRVQIGDVASFEVYLPLVVR
jgi:hypothetical protein